MKRTGLTGASEAEGAKQNKLIMVGMRVLRASRWLDLRAGLDGAEHLATENTGAECDTGHQPNISQPSTSHWEVEIKFRMIASRPCVRRSPRCSRRGFASATLLSSPCQRWYVG